MPGFSLHDELSRLSQAGLSNLRVLQTATLGSARYLGVRDRGTIERGSVADLVLLDADPLRDIRNTTTINSVVVRGQVIDPTARQRMLDDVKKAAAAQPAPQVAAAARCASEHEGYSPVKKYRLHALPDVDVRNRS